MLNRAQIITLGIDNHEVIMWLACLSILVAVLIWQARTAGPRRALGVVGVLSLLLPTWLVWEVAGLPIHLRIATGLAGLIGYCLHPQATFNLKLNVIDLVGLALLAVHVMSDWMNDGFSWIVPLRAYGEWGIPYLCGRLAIQSIDDVRKLLPYAVAVGMILATVSTVESVTKVNVVEQVFGNRPIDHTPRNLMRFSLKRSFGPTMHPIFLGTLQLLLFPWSIYGAARTRRGLAKWWKGAPWLAGVGTVLTLSRAPQLAVAVVLYVATLICKPQTRKWLLGLGAAGLVAGILAWQSVLYVIHALGGEQAAIEKRHPTVRINDEDRLSSSAMTRIHFFDIYSKAMRRAQWLGFGTERTTGFPPNIPLGPQDQKTLEEIWSVDNTYILMTLRFGYLGLICFTGLGIAAVARYVQLGCRPQVQGQVFFAAMAGTLVATMLVLLTVYMPHDFGFWYLWSVGSASGLSGRIRRELTPMNHSRRAEAITV